MKSKVDCKTQSAEGTLESGDQEVSPSVPEVAPPLKHDVVEEQKPETDCQPCCPKLTVGRQVHFYFETDGAPHAATVTEVVEDKISLAILCPHRDNLLFKENVPYSDAPFARHFTLPPKH